MNQKNGKTIHCKKCGIEIYVSKSRFVKKYCSFKCANDDKFGFKPRLTKCKICRKEFLVNSPWLLNHKLCSPECRGVGYEQAKIKRFLKLLNSRVETKCQYCKKKIISTEYSKHNFCGGKEGECRKKYYTTIRKGKKNPNYTFGNRVNGESIGSKGHSTACKKYRKFLQGTKDYLSCEKCGVNQNGTFRFEVHHIMQAGLYPRHKNLHDFANLILLCVTCHNEFHSAKCPHEYWDQLIKKRRLKELFQ